MPGDTRAVTPVISTVLLVAVVVVLASVVSGALWVSLVDGQPGVSPSEHSIVLTNETVSISHLGGGSLPISELRVIVRNSSMSATYDPTKANLSDASDDSFDPGETWSRNHSLQIQPGGFLEAALIHQPSNTLLAKQRVSAASLATGTTTTTTTAGSTTSTSSTTTTASTTTATTSTTTASTTTTTSQPPSFSGSQTASSNKQQGNDVTQVTFNFAVSNPSGQNYSLQFTVENQAGASTTTGPIVNPTSPRTVSGGNAFPTQMKGQNYLDVTIVLYDSDGTQVNSCTGQLTQAGQTITLTC